MEEKNTGLTKYKRMGDLSWHKLREYIPAMIMTNLSSFLLITVDGVVAGNLIGQDALASINIFYPVSILTGSMTILTSSGISICLSTAMGKNDQAELDRTKGVSVRVMIIMAVIASIVQIPVVWLVMRSYRLPDEIFAMTMQYAAGIMLCTPLGLISTVGTYQLQIAGKMNVLMKLSVMEGIANLLFDLFFMGVLDVGVGGAGFGTACANILRCSATVFYISRHTDMYRSSTKKVSASDVFRVLGLGVPDASRIMILAFQSYLMMKMILSALGTPGAAIKGVCSLCYSLANVLISGVIGSMRPLMGLYAGADDKEGMNILMQQGLILNLISGGLVTLIIELRPDWFFMINGVHDVPGGGQLAVRFYALSIIAGGAANLIRMYLSVRKDSGYATAITVAGNATTPLFAFALFKAAPAPFVFLAYPLTDILVLALSVFRYRNWQRRDREDLEKNGEDIVLYMTVRPEEAVEASRHIRKFADEHGIDQKIAYRVALCMEEMVAYAQEAETTGRLVRMGTDLRNIRKLQENLHSSNETHLPSKSLRDTENSVSVEIVVRFIGKNSAVFVSLDDGRCIALDKDEETDRLITDNYGLLRKLAKSVEYQYILNMNYTRFTF